MPSALVRHSARNYNEQLTCISATTRTALETSEQHDAAEDRACQGGIPIALDPEPRLGALSVRVAELLLAAAAEPDHLRPRRRREPVAALGAEVADPARHAVGRAPRVEVDGRRRGTVDVDDHRPGILRFRPAGRDLRRGHYRRGRDGRVSPHRSRGEPVGRGGRGLMGGASGGNRKRYDSSGCVRGRFGWDAMDAGSAAEKGGSWHTTRVITARSAGLARTVCPYKHGNGSVR